MQTLAYKLAHTLIYTDVQLRMLIKNISKRGVYTKTNTCVTSEENYRFNFCQDNRYRTTYFFVSTSLGMTDEEEANPRKS